MNFLTTVPATEAAAEAASLVFEPMNFVSNLRHMGVGMLVIFVIIGVIILATLLTGFLCSDTKK